MLPPFTGFVRLFSILCGITFLIQIALSRGPFAPSDSTFSIIQLFGLTPADVLGGHVYQLITWVFLHGGLMHLLFNCFGFWMFGSLVESTWGTRRFRNFCIVSGILTALCICAIGLLDAETFNLPTIGASGIVFATIMAVSVLAPNQVVLFFFVFPMKMKYFAYLMIAIEFYALAGGRDPLSSSTSTSLISHSAHLSGALIGYLLAKSNLNKRRGNGSSIWALVLSWKERWHQKRMRKKFKVIRGDQKIRYH